MNLARTIKKYFFLLLFGVLLFSSCNTLKIIRLLNHGDITPTHFKEEIPFEFRGGIIVIKVIIEGKTYDFIFDTGAVDCVSLELSEKLNLKSIAQKKDLDAGGRSEILNFSTLKKLTIGKIDFSNTACATIDLKKLPELACLKADGLIGANLMRKPVWQIDYQNRKIIFADNIDSLHVPGNTPYVAFSPLLSGTPVFKGKISGIDTHKNIFDTGSSGDIVLDKTDLDKLTAKDKAVKQVRGIGSNYFGLYGGKQDTGYLAQVPSIKIGTIEITNHITEFKKTDSGNFGSGFFKNYIVTFDWKSNKAWFMAQSKKEKDNLTSFGFSPIAKDGKMFISYLYDNSPALLSGLKLNDQIISVNSSDYSAISEDTYCDMITNKFSWLDTDTLNMVVRSANQERKIMLVRKNIFENESK